ncbi:MAG: Fis family transcriptional regulator [Proteobacteria bacterium]|nr:Fis family transcriptional regulator [Pseudomonadota bacterium]
MEIYSSSGSVQSSINSVKSFVPARVEQEPSRAIGVPFTSDGEFANKLDGFSLESVVEHKISRFLDQVGSLYPDDLHDLILGKVEKPLLTQILRRMGGNQVQASRVLGINRNTLRKKMKMHGIKS